jgi:hypothetical protein
MSQAVIQSIVSEMADAFVGVGLADAGVYTPAGGGTPIACRVFIKRDLAPFGTFGKVSGHQYELGLLLQEIAQPARGATVVADSQTFTLVELVKQDDAISTWSVQ